MKTICLVLLCSLVHSGFSFILTEKFLWKWSDCSDNATALLTVSHFDLSPKPMHLPGNVTFSLIGNIKQQLPKDAHYKLNVTMDKKLLNHWTPVVCKNKLGTCLYDDPCEFLQTFSHNNTCPQAFIDSGLSCTCPFNPVSLNVKSASFHVKAVPPKWSFLANGDFRARVEILLNQKMIGCFITEMSVKAPCHGFLCGGR